MGARVAILGDMKTATIAPALPAGSVRGIAAALIVLDRVTIDDHVAAGRTRLADMFRAQGRVAQIVARRPRGNKLHLIREYASGALVFEQTI